jgi:predicted RND superfamily exporter protein
VGGGLSGGGREAAIRVAIVCDPQRASGRTTHWDYECTLGGRDFVARGQVPRKRGFAGPPISVSAAVAFIVLLGIAVQNGEVLVAFVRQLRDQGATVPETMIQGCDLRFRPLFMTVLVSFIGHLPMLYATGSSADIQKPLAVVVMGGLVTSTLLTLFVLPTVYALFARRWGAGDKAAEV